jgi:hypothetical protein
MEEEEDMGMKNMDTAQMVADMAKPEGDIMNQQSNMEEDMGEESMRRREEGEEGEYAGGI